MNDRSIRDSGGGLRRIGTNFREAASTVGVASTVGMMSAVGMAAAGLAAAGLAGAVRNAEKWEEGMARMPIATVQHVNRYFIPRSLAS